MEHPYRVTFSMGHKMDRPYRVTLSMGQTMDHPPTLQGINSELPKEAIN